MMINVQVAVPEATRDALRALFESGNIPSAVQAQLALVADRVTDLGWQPTTLGGVTYYHYDLQADSEAHIALALAAFPGARVIGAWDFATGLPVGLSRDPDTGELTGEETYPFDAALHVAMRPAQVIRDPETGAITGHTPHTAPGDDHLWMGQAPRIYV